MRHNFNRTKQFSFSTGLLVCSLLMIIFGNASFALAENLKPVANENRANLNLFQNSFSLFTGCGNALNILGGTPYYDNDCKTDVSIYRPGTAGQFWIWNSSQNNSTVNTFGTTGNIPLGGDYDGDGITDLAVYNKIGSHGWWRIIQSSDSTLSETKFGTFPFDFPIPADYDGDNRTDIAIFRMQMVDDSIVPTFYFRQRNGNGTYTIPEPLTLSPETNENFIPVVNDYNNDGTADIAIWRKGDGSWKIKTSGSSNERIEQWGTTGDIPIPGKYSINGLSDGIVDLAVFRPTTQDWWVKNSNGGGSYVVHFGILGDQPVPGDYDGDGIWDIAIRRGSDNTFHILGSSIGYAVFPFGISGDIPIAAPREIEIDPRLACPPDKCGRPCPSDCS